MTRRSLCAALAVCLAGVLATAAWADDLKVVIYEVHSVTVPSGKYAGADGFILRAEPKEGEKDGTTIPVPDLKGVRITVDAKPATRTEVIEWVSDQRYPRVEVTTDPRKKDAPVEIRFYGCPPDARKKPTGR